MSIDEFIVQIVIACTIAILAESIFSIATNGVLETAASFRREHSDRPTPSLAIVAMPTSRKARGGEFHEASVQSRILRISSARLVAAEDSDEDLYGYRLPLDGGRF